MVQFENVLCAFVDLLGISVRARNVGSVHSILQHTEKAVRTPSQIPPSAGPATAPPLNPGATPSETQGILAYDRGYRATPGHAPTGNGYGANLRRPSKQRGQVDQKLPGLPTPQLPSGAISYGRYASESDLADTPRTEPRVFALPTTSKTMTRALKPSR